MYADKGRFLQKANPSKITFTNEVLAIDQRPVISKIKGRFVINEEIGLLGARESSTTAARARNRLEAVVRLLNDGKQAEALITASVTSWSLPDHEERAVSDARKWQFDPEQPRDDHGRWTDGDCSTGSSPLADVQYRCHFHDVVVDDLLQGLGSGGSKVLKNVPVLGLNLVLAIPDGASRPKERALPYFIEVKTGF